MRLAPSRALTQQAWWLESAATEYPAFQQFCFEQMAHARQGTTPPSDDDTGVRVRTSNVADPTSSHATSALHWQHQLDDAQDLVNNVAVAIRALRRHMLLTIRHEKEPLALCKDNQQGREGQIVWGDPTCERRPDKAGLCHAHYTDWYRYRKAAGIDTTRDYAA